MLHGPEAPGYCNTDPSNTLETNSHKATLILWIIRCRLLHNCKLKNE